MSDEQESLRNRLLKLSEKTSGPEYSTSFWVGDRAGERQSLDDLNSGRRLLADAHQMANQALGYLDDGEGKMAVMAAWAAHDLYISFLESWLARVKPSDRPSIAPAKRRGRPRKN